MKELLQSLVDKTGSLTLPNLGSMEKKQVSLFSLKRGSRLMQLTSVVAWRKVVANLW